MKTKVFHGVKTGKLGTYPLWSVNNDCCGGCRVPRTVLVKTDDLLMAAVSYKAIKVDTIIKPTAPITLP